MYKCVISEPEALLVVTRRAIIRIACSRLGPLPRHRRVKAVRPEKSACTVQTIMSENAILCFYDSIYVTSRF